MAKLDYEKVKAEIEKAKPDLDVDAEIKALRAKLKNISADGALLIIANKAGVRVKTDKPNATIKTIDSLRDGDDYVEIAGAVVNAYDLKFYEVCPSCAKRVREEAGIWKCQTHGVVEPAYSYLWNLMLDDGTGMIRCTLFSKQVNRLLGMDGGQVTKFRQKPESFEGKSELLGKLIAFRGRVQKNTHTQKNEFTAMLVYKEPKDVSPRTEAVQMLIEHTDKIPDDEELSEVEEIMLGSDE